MPLLTLTIVFSLIAGTMFLVWLGELITEYGIGNGISIIIFGGIVAGYPQLIQEGFLAAGQFDGACRLHPYYPGYDRLIVIFTEAHRRIPVQYARSVFRGGRMYRQSGSTHIPMRVNSAGMIPLIFSMSVVLFPGIVASYFVKAGPPGFADTIVTVVQPEHSLAGGGVLLDLYFLLSVGFHLLLYHVTYQQQDLPGTLQKAGRLYPRDTAR